MQFTNETYQLLGIALLKSQIVEFNLCGILVHINKNCLSKNNKRLNELTPEKFLSSNPEYQKLRKMTLGEISVCFPSNIINSDKIEEYISDRNIVVHNFIRETDSKFATNGVINPTDFLQKFINDSNELINVLHGLIYVMSNIIADKNKLYDRKFSGQAVEKAMSAFYQQAPP